MLFRSRNARHGLAFTSHGKLSIKQARYLADDRPLDPACRCSVCQQFSRSYIRHLFVAGEMLFATLVSIHNLAFYLQLARDARAAICADRYGDWQRDTLAHMAGGIPD